MGALNVFTYTLTDDTLTIVASDNVVRVSIVCNTGTINVEGNATFNGLSSNAVDFAVGQGITLTSPTVQNPIDGVTIDASGSGNSADIVISYQ
jgi:hypothetical protein